MINTIGCWRAVRDFASKAKWCRTSPCQSAACWTRRLAGPVFSRLFRRTSATDELTKLLQFWKEQFDYFDNRTAAAVQVAVTDPKQIPPDVNLHKVAAWAMVSRAILNLDETITKE